MVAQVPPAGQIKDGFQSLGLLISGRKQPGEVCLGTIMVTMHFPEKAMNRHFSRLAAALMVLVIASTAHAQSVPAVPGASQHLPISHPAYADIETLAREGFPSLPADQVLVTPGDLRTRWSFAVATARVLNRVRLEDRAAWDGKPEARTALRRLIHTFRWELQALGADTRAANRLFSLLEVPSDHWAYQAIDVLQNNPVPIYYGGYEARTYKTRREFATATAQILKGDVDVSARNSPSYPGRRSKAQRLTLLRRLVREFGPELQLLAVDTQAAVQRLSLLIDEEERFKGVARTHWAFESVETVRKAGVLRGFPDGMFLTDER